MVLKTLLKIADAIDWVVFYKRRKRERLEAVAKELMGDGKPGDMTDGGHSHQFLRSGDGDWSTNTTGSADMLHIDLAGNEDLGRRAMAIVGLLKRLKGARNCHDLMEGFWNADIFIGPVPLVKTFALLTFVSMATAITALVIVL